MKSLSLAPFQTVRRFAGTDAAAFVPVEIVDDATTAGGLTLISPDGYRVEKLAVADVAEILRRLR